MMLKMKMMSLRNSINRETKIRKKMKKTPKRSKRWPMKRKLPNKSISRLVTNL